MCVACVMLILSHTHTTQHTHAATYTHHTTHSFCRCTDSVKNDIAAEFEHCQSDFSAIVELLQRCKFLRI